VGLAGGLLARWRRLPAGAMLGAMVLVAALNMVLGREPQYPVELRLVVQVVAGAVLGLNFTRSDVVMLRRLAKPATMIVVVMLGFNVVFALIIARFTVLDPITALFAAAPGGVSDMALIAADFGADTSKVAVLQLFRFVLIVSLFPFIVRRAVGGSVQEVAEPLQALNIQKPEAHVRGSLCLTLLAAAAGGAAARWLGIPAGALLGALTATVIVNAVLQRAYLPQHARTVVQICAGCFIGSQITLAALMYLQHLLLPMALAVVQIMAMTFGTAWLLRRFCAMDMGTSIFSCIPGGLTEMSLIAHEMGLRVPEIVMLNTCRLIGVIFMLPILLFLILQI